jgi:flagellar biosynthesis protein FlhF
MKTKKIVADTMPQALKMVRQQLGDNAIIVNTRAINTGGIFGFFTKQKYEVTAYTLEKETPSIERKTEAEPKEILISLVEEQEGKELNSPDEEEKQNSVFHRTPQKLYQFYSQPEMIKENNAAQQEEKSKTTVNEEKASARESITSQRPKSGAVENQLLDEMKQMRKMMMTLMMGEKQVSNLPTGLLTHVNQLRKQGVNEEVIEYIVNHLIVNSLLKQVASNQEMSEELIMNEMIAIIEAIINKRVTESTTKINESTRMINIVGPTGVGKTTSIAKLATVQVLKQKRRVAMITTDVYRIAAVEQLKTYAGILNVPIEVVESVDDLEKAIEKLAHFDLIYMDTTGRNYKEVKYRDSINRFINLSQKSDNYLVLSLTTKFEDMEILLKEFSDSPLKKLILTKFDETTTYGSILNIAYKYPYQLAYITNGQSVPEDIAVIDPSLIARYLVGEEK